jgi:hypothetical protein
MPRVCTNPLKYLSDEVLDEALARTPGDHYVIWNGHPCRAQAGSVRSRALSLVEEIWEPLPLRILLRRAARLSGTSGLDPDTVRSAIRMHQSASPAAYLLVRRAICGDYVAVTDVPYPSSGSRRLSAGDVVLGRSGDRFDINPVAPHGAASAAHARAGASHAQWRRIR